MMVKSIRSSFTENLYSNGTQECGILLPIHYETTKKKQKRFVVEMPSHSSHK